LAIAAEKKIGCKISHYAAPQHPCDFEVNAKQHITDFSIQWKEDLISRTFSKRKINLKY
jgi:hypothetical protein